jgi:hypothetical protein
MANFGQGDLVPVLGHERGQELLVGAASVDVGGVDQRDAGLQRGLQGVAGGGLVGVAVELADAHGAEALDADLRAPVRSEVYGRDLLDAHVVLPGARRTPA